MRKKVMGLIILFLSLVLIVGCTKDNDKEGVKNEKSNIQFCYRDGIPGLTVAKLIKENPIIDENIIIDYQMEETPDLLTTKILKEEADIAIVPSNFAAIAYNKELPYKIVGTSTWGTMYLVGTEDIDSFEDLKGKEIYAFGKGLTPDIILRFVLEENDIIPDEDVKITYVNAASDLGAVFLSGKADLALFTEPLATNVMLKNEDANIILDLDKEWKDITGMDKGYPQASLIIKTDLVENNKEFVEEFIKTYEESIEWAKKNPEKLGEYAEELELSMKKAIIVEGMKRINIGNFPIEDSKEEYKTYYNLLLDFAPDSIGGKLPDEEIFYKK